MNELIELLKDGKSRTPEMLAMELGTSTDIVKRDIEFLERMGAIKRIGFLSGSNTDSPCGNCTACGTGKKTCAGCMPEGGFKNMGVMWEIVD